MNHTFLYFFLVHSVPLKFPYSWQATKKCFQKQLTCLLSEMNDKIYLIRPFYGVGVTRGFTIDV